MWDKEPHVSGKRYYNDADALWCFYTPQNHFYIFEQMRLNHMTAVSSPAVQNKSKNQAQTQEFHFSALEEPEIFGTGNDVINMMSVLIPV